MLNLIFSVNIYLENIWIFQFSYFGTHAFFLRGTSTVGFKPCHRLVNALWGLMDKSSCGQGWWHRCWKGRLFQQQRGSWRAFQKEENGAIILRNILEGIKCPAFARCSIERGLKRQGGKKIWRLDVDFRLHFLGREEPLMVLREVWPVPSLPQIYSMENWLRREKWLA